MAFEITRTEVWSGELPDHPGALAEKLAALQRAGANLEFVILRPISSVPGMGILFLAPIFGPAQTQAAEEAGLAKSTRMHVLRIVGPDRPGLAAGIARTLGEARLNIRGVSAAGLGDRSLFYIRFDSEDDLTRATALLAGKLD